jgi:hypothetical protein
MPGWKGTAFPFHPGLPTDHLEEKQIQLATHTHLLPETCRGMVIQ